MDLSVADGSKTEQMKLIPESPRECIVVLGMHRSGTSATAGLLGNIGVEFGNRLMAATQENIKGYWEHEEIVRVHDKLLAGLGLRWDDVRTFPPLWWNSKPAEEARKELFSIIRADFQEAPLWGLKDPRMCRLMDLWHMLFSELDTTVKFVCVFRHPTEVAASLGKRNAMSFDKALLMWFQHVTAAERATRNHPRVIVSFNSVLNNREEAVNTICRKLQLEVHHDDDSGASDFPDARLKHHRVEDADADTDDSIPSEVADVYKALESAELGDEGELSSICDRATASYERSLQTLAARGMLGHIDDQSKSFRSMAEATLEARRHAADRNKRVSGLEASMHLKELQIRELSLRIAQRDMLMNQRTVHRVTSEKKQHAGWSWNRVKRAVRSLPRRLKRSG
jgi:hypothetical protein